MVCQRSTIGMTDEFGAQADSQHHPAVRYSSDPTGRPADSSDASPACKLPPEFLSADSSVYDPFDSSDSDEFFSSSDDGSDNESDYGSPCEHSSPDNTGGGNGDGDGGVVFGVLPLAGSAEIGAGAGRSCGSHQRKGTLGEINFSCDEKDEERELAKTAGTPAFFAPELCCMPDELAKVLRHERILRRSAAAAAAAAAAMTAEHQHQSASARASPVRRTHTMHVASSEGEADSVHRRPLSLVVESPAAGDGARGSPKGSKRHSTIASLLARPFSSRDRPSSRCSSLSSIAPPAAQPDDVDGGSDDEADRSLPASLITPAIDIWAMGVTLYCLIYGRVPFQASTEFELFNIIPRKALEFPRYLDVADDDDDDDVQLAPASGLFGASDDGDDDDDRVRRRTRRVQLPELDPDARDLLCRMLEKDFRRRITIDEIKRHPWVVKDLEHPTSWAKETDPTCRPSLTITVQEVEQAMVPKVHRQRGFRASVRRRISLLSPRASRAPRTATAKAKSSLDWLKIW
ncbi:hypothetical protein H4R21_003253 [Coemansia helicoidea]|uniref:Uncharacterized protein n=2 Tax=Coemansia TaxID=4863 RepID=A0ACC1L4E0_9FUNG|nr:hypothetical protein H4R21_003253 [Coemansia helicoidea]